MRERTRSTSSWSRTFAACVLAFCMVFCSVFVPQGRAYPADVSDTLKVYVGYTGGPFYLKAEFTTRDIMNMAGYGMYEYSSFNARPAPAKGIALGVPITNLVEAAGVDNASMCRLFLQTTDNYGGSADGPGMALDSYLELVDRTRYYFGDLWYYWNYGDREIYDDYNELWDLESTSAVPSIISIQSIYQTTSSTEDGERVFGTHSLQGATSQKGFRLFMGQSSPNEYNAYANTYAIEEIYCIIGGRNGTDLPEIVLDQTAFEGSVGESVTVTPRLKSQDATVDAEGIKNINWYSEDESVAVVTRNDDGSITITFVGEGVTTIYAEYGDSQYGSFVSGASFGLSGGGGGFGEGHGNGSGSGSGDASGDGLDDFLESMAGGAAEGFGNGNGKSGSVVLSAGTQLFSASLASTGDGADADAGGGGGEDSGDGTEFTSQEIEVQVKPNEYKLDFEDITEQFVQKQQEMLPWSICGTAGGTFLGVGAIASVFRFNREKDPYTKNLKAKG